MGRSTSFYESKKKIDFIFIVNLPPSVRLLSLPPVCPPSPTPTHHLPQPAAAMPSSNMRRPPPILRSPSSRPHTIVALPSLVLHTP